MTQRSGGQKTLDVVVMILVFLGILITGCAATGTPESTAAPPQENQTETNVNPAITPGQPNNFVVDPEKLEFGQYMEEKVDNFVLILDASASKHLPYDQQVKLKVAKDIVRRFNKKTPERPLFGGLRRYGFDAGAFSTDTELVFGMEAYNRDRYAEAIEVIRWAGGKTPMAPVIAKGGDDLDLAPQDQYLALVLVSDGKIGKSEPDPVLAARKLKERFGDRICIYTVAVGDDIPFEKPNTPEDQFKYRDKFKLMGDIAREGKCGYTVTSDDLIPETNMDQFVYDVFHRTRHLKTECPDEDQDGVCDDVDRCPGTPRGAKVDEHGCWLLPKVQFDLNKWNILSHYNAELDEVARVLNLNPNVQIGISGHCCTIWTDDYNIKLSQWRAMSVASYLMNRGVRSEQLSVEGFGFHRPFAPNDTEDGRRLNRRAELRQIK